jgi:flagellar biosynthesis protein
MSDPARPRAAALSYDAKEDAAPRLVARGEGAVAEAILDLARQHGVAVRSDPALCSLLAVLEIGDEVPPELYEAVARLVACLVELDGAALGATDARSAGFERQRGDAS